MSDEPNSWVDRDQVLADAISKTAPYGDHLERARTIVDILAVHDYRIVHMPAGSPLWQHFSPVFCVSAEDEASE